MVVKKNMMVRTHRTLTHHLPTLSNTDDNVEDDNNDGDDNNNNGDDDNEDGGDDVQMSSITDHEHSGEDGFDVDMEVTPRETTVRVSSNRPYIHSPQALEEEENICARRSLPG